MITISDNGNLDDDIPTVWKALRSNWWITFTLLAAVGIFLHVASLEGDVSVGRIPVISTIQNYMRPAPSHQHYGCVGFEKLHYKDHLFKAVNVKTIPDDLGIWDVGDYYRESIFQLRIQNGAGVTLRLREMDVEYPEGVHVTWSERGYDCDYYNIQGDTTSGCLEMNISEADIKTFKMEDVGRGIMDLRYGTVYRSKVKVTWDVFNSLGGPYTETAICSGKIE